jgi:perosamine synthetase
MKKNSILEKIIKGINKTLDNPKKLIPLHEPQFDKNEFLEIKKCLQSSFVSSAGKMTKVFEEKIRILTKSKYSIALINGTSAIHLGLKTLGVKYQDEVLTPSLTFAGTTNAIILTGATPHFVESEHETLGVDPYKLKEYLKKNTFIKNGFCFNKITRKKISALVVVHVFGHPAKIEELIKISNKFKIPILEDAAECIGSFFKKKHLGTFGKIGVISFNGNKTITTGGGGVILTENLKIYKTALHLSLGGKKKHKWEYIHDIAGFNYRLPAINASLGVAQLKKLKKLIKNKRILYDKYSKNFNKIKELRLIKEPKNSFSNYWLQTIILSKKYAYLKNKILLRTNFKKIMTRPVWRPMHLMEHFKKFPRMDLKVTEEIYLRAINLPSSPNLGKQK